MYVELNTKLMGEMKGFLLLYFLCPKCCQVPRYIYWSWQLLAIIVKGWGDKREGLVVRDSLQRLIRCGGWVWDDQCNPTQSCIRGKKGAIGVDTLLPCYRSSPLRVTRFDQDNRPDAPHQEHFRSTQSQWDRTVSIWDRLCIVL